MTIEEILQAIEKAERNAAKTATEPLAAHTILPLLKELSQFVATTGQAAAQMQPVEPQSAMLSVQLVSELRSFLQAVAFVALINGWEEEDENLQARKLFLALESEIRRVPIEIVAQDWMTWVQEQQALLPDDEEEEGEEAPLEAPLVVLAPSSDQTVQPAMLVETPPKNEV